TRQENTKLLSFRGVNAASLVAWRDEVAYTNQRMEYLRDNTHAFGAWAQVYGGESSYDDATVDLTTTTVQVGADTTIGDWIAGAAFSYSKGDADMANGSADTDSYTLSLYTARNFDSGFYVNGLARYGRLSTDATAGNMTASYDNNAFSIGGNVGYRFNFAQQAFVEPNFGLQYAYVMGDDYTATNGVKVEQDDFDALIASLGARVGFNFAEDAGKIYARASVNHDFLGEVDGTASKAGLADSMYVDLGGTWVTYGIGTQFNFTENLSVWGNIDRTTGGEVSTHYMMNAGLRYVF
ncbi:MAG TPA: autotransporter outer membrane beta-barrel domain-containing protein, partial [Candidatus Aphodousia gallistercoris]|nr:autotransporter outer membrane beta-barrel domain-containing protein [Candidatus Aphodousia gallistercoris]